MPRYAVPCTVTAVYTNYLSADTEAEIVAMAAALAPPAPWTSDWRFEIVGQPELEPIGPNHDGTKLCSRLRVATTSRRTVTARAKDEAEATAKALKACDQFRDDVVDHFAPDGWSACHKDRAVETGKPRRDDGAIRARKSFDVDLRRLIAPNASLHPLSIDQAFETFRWMVATSRNYEERCSYHVEKVWHLLRGSTNRSHDTGVPEIVSERDLKDRFAHAVLGLGYDIYDQWREEHGIHPTARLTIEALHHGPNVNRFDSHIRPRGARQMETLESALWAYASNLPGMKLSVQLNSCHKGADVIAGFGVLVLPNGFAFRLRYGYEGSSWSHDVAITRGDETFAETLDRAISLLATMVPDYDEQLEARRRADLRKAA